MEPHNPEQNPFAEPPTGAPPIAEPYGKAGPPDSDSRTMAMLAHLLGALIGFLGPLVIWLVKKDQHPFVDDQAKEALNFHITLIFAYVVAGIITAVSCGFLFFVAFIPYVLQVIFGILAAVESNKGVYYRYPMTLRLVN